MKKIDKAKQGFTLVELLVTVLIMGTGFLALSQMEYLSLNLKQKAEEGTRGSNVLQLVIDSDISDMKKVHMLNVKAYMDGITTRSLDLAYCSGGTNSYCGTCPCDPLEILTPNPDNGVTETTCSIVDVENFDPTFLDFVDQSTCMSDFETFSNAGNELLIILKQASTTVITTNIPNLVNVDMTYVSKTPEQFIESGMNIELRNSIVREAFGVTAHIDNFTDDVPVLSSWTQVRIPHLP